MDDTFFEIKGISQRKSFIHSASFPVSAKATNSDSIVECVMQVCFLDLQEIAPPPKVNTQPDVDLFSPKLDIQLASVYPSKRAGNFE